jgi:hypothetical protein
MVEAQWEGIEYQPPPTCVRREQNQELRTLKSYIYQGPTHLWSGMAYDSLRKSYPATHERYVLKKNGGHWMFGFRGGEDLTRRKSPKMSRRATPCNE